MVPASSSHRANVHRTFALNCSSPPRNQKRVIPFGITRFWYECSYGTFGKGAPYQRLSASNLLRFHPHPCGMRLKPEGLSHGLKTVHRTVFTRPAAGPPFRVPPVKSKTGHPGWDNPFLVRRKGLATLWCRRRRAAAGQMSTGHLHLIVRVLPEIKNGLSHLG